MFELSSEDALRLNVMMAGDLQAVRIDTNSMTVYGLSPRGTASVKLHPNCRPDQYLRTVREILAGHALGSPGGYPVHLQRWTRMGQARDRGLDKLLLLGEPEAVTSVAYSNGLTDELARRAWWAMPVPDHARRMLERACVVEGSMGKVLSDFLVDYLPFETDPHIIVDTIKILLQPGLIDEKTRNHLWNKGTADNAYLVGFLAKIPDDLPEQKAPRTDFDTVQAKLQSLANHGNLYAISLLRLLSGPGQSFLQALEEVLRYPANQDIVNALLDALWEYFGSHHRAGDKDCEHDIETLSKRAADEFSRAAEDAQLTQTLQAVPELSAELQAILLLTKINANVAKPILSQTTANGTLMRKKLEPVTLPLLQQLAVLQAKEFSDATSRRRRSS